MLNKIIKFSIENKLIIGIMAVVWTLVGLYQFAKLPIDAVPDITDNQVQIITTAPSLGAPDVESLLTFPIEQANSNIPGLKQIRSFSRFGLSLVTLVFDEEVDIYWARNQVTERLKQAEAQMPAGLGVPELAPVTTGLGEIYQYVIKPKAGYEQKYTTTELRTIQDWIVRRQLLGVKGVADVSSFGGRLKQYEIAVNASVLKNYGITIPDVFKAVEQNNENTGGSYIENRNTVMYVRTEGLVKSIADIENIVIKNNNGMPIRVRDVAVVQIGNATRYGAVTYNNTGEVAGAVVMMLKGANSNLVIEEVKNKIEIIKKTLPEGVELVPFLDRTKMVNSAISTIAKNLLEGALIVIFILVLFLGNARAGLLVASVIPLSMLFAVIMMNLFGVSGNLMSLGALDFGLIVDGAVIIVEAVLHSFVSKKIITQSSGNEKKQLVQNSAQKMMNSAVFGQIIILIVYLPIFSLQGIEGKMFKPMAQTVAFALLGAFILSLTYIPMMSSLFLKPSTGKINQFSNKLIEKWTAWHQRYLTKALGYPKQILALVALLFVFSVLVLANMGGEFIPELPEGDFAVETRVLQGSNLATSTKAVSQSAGLLLKTYPEIEKIVGKTGSGEIPTDPMPMEASDMMIILKDQSEWTSASTWNELSEKMSKTLEAIPGVLFSFQYPVAMRFNELMTGAKQDVVCKLFGENLDSLSVYAEQIGKIANKIEGAQNIYVEPIDGLPQLIVTYNRNAMAQYGLNIKDLNGIINTAFAGQSTGLVFEDEKRFDLVVRLQGTERQQISDVQNLLIPIASGEQIPLSAVAQVQVKESVNQIQREDAKRRIIVGFNIGDRDVQSVVNDLKLAVESKIKLPTGYYITYGGAFENLQAAKKRLGIAVPVSLLLILVLLYFTFQSIKQGLLIFTAIPLSAVGGILLLAMRGMPFSISAGIGFIALFGVAVLNGIVLIAEFNSLRKQGITNLTEVVLTGTKHRFRPVLLTALVASLGFLPMALSHSASAEVQRPLATVVIGGLLLATFLTLFILPILYIIFENNVNLNINKKVGLILFSLGLGFSAKAQTLPQISLQAAVDTAIKNNGMLKVAWLQTAYLKELQGTAKQIEPTFISAQYGQLNSIYKDNAVSASQNLVFPTVYAKQKALYAQQYQLSLTNYYQNTKELAKKVSECYAYLVYLHQKKQLLTQADSIYTHALELAKQRQQAGESALLETANAQILKDQIRVQFAAIQSDWQWQLLQFQYLLNSAVAYAPFNEFNLNTLATDTALAQTPVLQIALQQQATNWAQYQWSKTKLLPGLQLGLQSGTMLGIGADNVDYTLKKRFNSVLVSFAIPVFANATKSQIKADYMQYEQSKNLFAAQQNRLAVQRLQAFNALQNAYALQQYYTDTALPNAQHIANSTQQMFNQGQLNYIEWSVLTSNALQVQSQFIENQYQRYLKQIQYHYFYLNNN